MKRDRLLTALACVLGWVLIAGVIMVTGCAKKEIVKQESDLTTEKKAEAKASPPAKAPARPTAEAKTKVPDVTSQQMKDGAREGQKKTASAAALDQSALYEFIDIHFDFDQYSLRTGDREIMKKHGAWLVKNSNAAVAIEGYCDERGTAEYNLALGQKRADEAAKFLRDMGTNEKRIKTVSYGKERPLDPGHNEDAWAKNRRAHFVVSTKK